MILNKTKTESYKPKNKVHKKQNKTTYTVLKKKKAYIF